MEFPEWRIPPRRATSAFQPPKQRLYNEQEHSSHYDTRPDPCAPKTEKKPKAARGDLTASRGRRIAELTEKQKQVLELLHETEGLSAGDVMRKRDLSQHAIASAILSALCQRKLAESRTILVEGHRRVLYYKRP